MKKVGIIKLMPEDIIGEGECCENKNCGVCTGLGGKLKGRGREMNTEHLVTFRVEAAGTVTAVFKQEGRTIEVGGINPHQLSIKVLGNDHRTGAGGGWPIGLDKR